MSDIYFCNGCGLTSYRYEPEQHTSICPYNGNPVVEYLVPAEYKFGLRVMFYSFRINRHPKQRIVFKHRGAEFEV